MVAATARLLIPISQSPSRPPTDRLAKLISQTRCYFDMSRRNKMKEEAFKY
jgi:hypothetical protein